MTYLEVKVTRKYKDLFKKNFVPLLENTKLDFQRGNYLPLSLMGRVNSIKMNILPKFLYLFQCIPCYIPKEFFVTLDKHVSAFISNSKSPRIRKDFMQRPRPMGGLALPISSLITGEQIYETCYIGSVIFLQKLHLGFRLSRLIVARLVYLLC